MLQFGGRTRDLDVRYGSSVGSFGTELQPYAVHISTDVKNSDKKSLHAYITVEVFNIQHLIIDSGDVGGDRTLQILWASSTRQDSAEFV